MTFIIIWLSKLVLFSIWWFMTSSPCMWRQNITKCSKVAVGGKRLHKSNLELAGNGDIIPSGPNWGSFGYILVFSHKCHISEIPQTVSPISNHPGRNLHFIIMRVTVWITWPKSTSAAPVVGECEIRCIGWQGNLTHSTTNQFHGKRCVSAYNWPKGN
jgi:hypothetical protein